MKNGNGGTTTIRIGSGTPSSCDVLQARAAGSSASGSDADDAAERDQRQQAQRELASGSAAAGRARRGRWPRPARRAGARAHTPSLRRSSPTWRRAIGTSAPSAITSTAVPFSRGRTSTARRRLTTKPRCTRRKPCARPALLELRRAARAAGSGPVGATRARSRRAPAGTRIDERASSRVPPPRRRSTGSTSSSSASAAAAGAGARPRADALDRLVEARAARPA